MIDFLLNLHKIFYGSNEKNHYKTSNLFLWLLTNLMSRGVEKFLYVWLVMRRICNIRSSQKGVVNDEIILSFTSFPARIKNVWMVVDSIFRQTMLPGKIQLWLSEENFPNRDLDLPLSLMRYVKMGLEICWVKEDLKPHKKYLYSFRMFPNKCVVTIDDDIYYRKDLVESLWNLHLRFPNCVCGHRGCRISLGKPYKDWSSGCETNKPSHDYLLTGCGGVIYSVELFKKVSVDNPEMIKELSLTTDDLWLKTMEVLNEIPVVIGDYYPNGPVTLGSQKKSLMSKNCDALSSNNDISWTALDRMFSVEKKILDLNNRKYE